jgi:hypothetical protein
MFTTILTTFYLVFHLVTYETKISLLMKLSDYAIFLCKIANTVTPATTLVLLTQIGWYTIAEEVNTL